MDPKLLAEEIARAVRARVGKNSPEVEKLIAEEVGALLSRAAAPATGLSGEHPSTGAAVAASAGLPEPQPSGHSATERIVVSANGRNKHGIVAGLTQVISDHEGDIRDISQTIVGDYFTMVIVVDIAGATQKGKRFGAFKERLEAFGRQTGVHVVALHDDLLSAMHSV